MEAQFSQFVIVPGRFLSPRAIPFARCTSDLIRKYPAYSGNNEMREIETKLCAKSYAALRHPSWSNVG
jgi:hypothetical protein